MTSARTMLDTAGPRAGADPERVAAALDALVECAITCVQCADACLSEQDVSAMARCIRLDLACADICSTTGRVVALPSEEITDVTRALLVACIAACRACGDECASHAETMRHCEICSAACRRCEEACRDLLDAGDSGPGSA